MGFSKEKRTPEESVASKDPSPKGGEMPPPKPIPTGGTPTIPEVVDRLEELVKFALECEGKELREGVSFVDVFKQLEEVRHAIEFLNQDQKELLALFTAVAGEGGADIAKTALTNDDKKILEKLKHLQSICEAAKERMYTTMKAEPEVESLVQEQIAESKATEKQKIVKRKGKFRPLGGKEGWVRT